MPSSSYSALVQRRKLSLKAEVESGISHFSFNPLSSRRFQLRFDRVNLDRTTLVIQNSGLSFMMSASTAPPRNTIQQGPQHTLV